VAGILDILLDLSFLPAGSRVAELRLEQIMAGHGLKAYIDVTLLATSNLVDGRAHVIVYSASRNATEYPEGMVVGVKQHLMCLQEIGAYNKGSRIAELGMSNLQLHSLTADDSPIFRPIELEGLTRFKAQRHKGPSAYCLLLLVLISAPFPRKGGHTAIGTFIAKGGEVRMQLLYRTFLLTRLLCLCSQPDYQTVGKWIEFTWSLGNLKLRLHVTETKIFANGVPG